MAENVDGAVVIVADMNISQAEKKLSKLKTDIVKTEQELADLRKKRSEAREKSTILGGTIEAEQKKLSELKNNVKEIQTVMKDKSYSAGIREEAKLELPDAKEKLKEQEQYVRALESEFTKFENSVDRYDKKIADSEAKLISQEANAGELTKQITEGEHARNDNLSQSEVVDQRIVDLNKELVALKERQMELEASGVGLGHEEYDAITVQIGEVNDRLRKYRANLLQSENAADNMGKASKRAAGYMDNFEKRMKGALASAFINVLSAGLRQFTGWVGKSIKTNDQARQAIARLKGALLILAQPIVEVIIPAFTLLVNILSKVVTAVAQLVSALFGKTLKQSRDGAKAMYEEANAIEGVGSAADKASGSLAGFDEINTISTDNAVGAGGGGKSDIGPDFSWGDGDGGIIPRLKEIADLVLMIGAGFALWKIGQMLPGVLEQIATGLGAILMTVGGLLLYWNGLTDAWENGVDWLNLIEMVGGLAAAAFALYQLLGPIAASIALVIGGVGMLVAGFRDAMENGWSLQSLLLSMAGLFAAGLGIALLTGSWIPALIGGIAAVLLAVTVATGHGEELLNGIRTVMDGFLTFFTGIFIGNFSQAVQGLIQIFYSLNTAATAVLEGVRNVIGLFLEWLDEKTNGQFHEIIEIIRGIVSGLIDGAEQLLNGLLEFLAGVFTGDLEMVLSGINAMVEGLKTAMFAVVDGLQALLVGFLDWLDEKTNGRFHSIIEVAKSFVTGFFTTVKETLGNILNAIKQTLSVIIQFITGVFTGNWSQAWEGIQAIFKGVWNGIISLLEGAVNFIVRGINSLISGLNSLKLPDWLGGGGISIPRIPEAKLPRLAQGAVIPPNREFMAVLGDQSSGNNLEAPEGLIRRIVREESKGGGDYSALLQAILEAIRSGHVIMVDRTILGQVVTREQNRMTRQSGRSVLLG